MRFLIDIAAVSVTLLVLASVLPGVRIANRGSAVVTALVIGVLNLLLGWLLTLVVATVLLVPALLTFGLAFALVSFIVNTILLWLTDKLLDAFEIKNLRALLVTSLVITIVHSAVHHLAR